MNVGLSNKPIEVAKADKEIVKPAQPPHMVESEKDEKKIFSDVTPASLLIWHYRLGHRDKRSLRELLDRMGVK